MAIRSSFFNSVNGDRRYDAKKLAEYFASFIGNGVFPKPSANLQVIANNNMTVTVKAGKSWINGYIMINDDDYLLQIEPADGSLNRIDRIVARWDATDREIRVEVKKGTFASNPVAPALQRDADAYELGLADVRINKGSVSITQANITDLRLSTELCGIVHGLVEQVDTEVLFQDYMSWIEQKKGEFNIDLIDYTDIKKQEFEAWVNSIKDILDENVAGNLLNMININTDAINELNNEVDAHIVDFEAFMLNLANIQNYGIATKAEAEAGTSNIKYMTPFRVYEAIKALESGFVKGSYAGSGAAKAITLGFKPSLVFVTFGGMNGYPDRTYSLFTNNTYRGYYFESNGTTGDNTDFKITSTGFSVGSGPNSANYAGQSHTYIAFR